MPIYEYECSNCGARFEERKPMDERHNAVCLQCGGKPQILISPLAKRNPYDERITLTVVDSKGNVVGKRHDHRRTPLFNEFHSKEVQQEAQHGQEMATK